MQTEAETGEGMYGFIGCTVKQFMTRTVMTVNRQTTMRELAGLFEKHDFNAFPVAEDGKLFGIISKFDFLGTFAFSTNQVVPHYNELMNRAASDSEIEAGQVTAVKMPHQIRSAEMHYSIHAKHNAQKVI
jgi:CBS-domain-containing membrane protein